jgi:hypothetical protein
MSRSGWGMCKQKMSDAVSPRKEVACPRTKIQPDEPSRGLVKLSTISDGCTHRLQQGTLDWFDEERVSNRHRNQKEEEQSW